MQKKKKKKFERCEFFQPFLQSNATRFGGPDHFVHLNLETDREGIGDDALGQLPARNGSMTVWYGVQRRMLLLGS